ncbi:MAG: FliO/MopB family protein, partial [Solirubrobacterales bacterium]
ENLPVNLGSGSTTTSHVGGSGGSIVRTIVGLAIVIAVIWGLSWILRQFKSGREPHTSSTGLTSLAALTLSHGRSVHLVRAGNDYVLLGSAEQGVVPIHRYTEEEAREAGLMDVIEAPRGSRRGLLRQPGGGAAPAPRNAGSESQNAADHDPMQMPSPGPGSSVVDRLRELTVRR